MQLEVKGLVLLGVSLAREVVPSFARVLLHTSLGRHMLRPLLRSEIGQVTTRRAWHDTSKLTSETLDLYKVCTNSLYSLNSLVLCFQAFPMWVTWKSFNFFFLVISKWNLMFLADTFACGGLGQGSFRGEQDIHGDSSFVYLQCSWAGEMCWEPACAYCCGRSRSLGSTEGCTVFDITAS